MKDVLIKFNYYHFGHCNCDGFPTEKYRAGDFELRLRENKNLFKVKRLGRSITQWQSTTTLLETLENIHANINIHTA